jgi:peptidoglycan/LPS O-acetylase OafA/YrhL
VLSASDTNTPTTRSQRRRDIQGIRGVAVALVVLYHSGLPVPGGFIGVDVFFVVSGYVITLMLMRELKATGSIAFGRFYRRRARRLLPALALMLTVIGLLSVAILGPLGQQQQALDTGISASLFVANLQLISAPGGYFAGAAEANPFLHTWSLSVEEQFYLFLPVVLAIVWQVANRRRRPSALGMAGTVVSGLVIASFLLSYSWSTPTGVDHVVEQSRAFFSSVSRIWEFGIGVLLALAAHRLLVLSPKVSSALGAAGFGLITFGAFSIDGTTAFPSLAAVLPVLGTAMLLAAGTNAAPIWTTRALCASPAVWVGDISYSWYLWHWPFIVFARTLWPASPVALPIAAAMSLVPAVLAYHHVEQPIRLGERIPKLGGLRTAVTAIVIPLFALTLLALSGQAVRDLPEVAELSHTTRYHIDAASGCASAQVDIGMDCVRSTSDFRGSVYLLGDSNAGQFTEPLAAAAAAGGFDFAIAVRSGCPPIEVASLHHGYPEPQCVGFPRDAVEAIRRDRPDIVILAAASDIYIGRERWELIDGETHAVVSDPDGKALVWRKGLEALLDELEQIGTEVRVVNPVPHFFAVPYTVNFGECAAFRLVSDPTTCGAQAPRDVLNAQRHQAVQAELAAVATVPSASSVDFFDFLCPSSSCSMYADGRWLYRDGTHLSVDGSLELTESFSALLAAASG